MQRRFIVRVELHGAEDKPDVYEELDEAMESHGFSRTIKGGTYELPPGEYNRVADSLAAEVFKDARAAAKEVWRDFSVLVRQTSQERVFYSLKKAE
jgi:hypothetical protein